MFETGPNKGQITQTANLLPNLDGGEGGKGRGVFILFSSVPAVVKLLRLSDGQRHEEEKKGKKGGGEQRDIGVVGREAERRERKKAPYISPKKESTSPPPSLGKKITKRKREEKITIFLACSV